MTKQLLHLVFGGELTRPDGTDFVDPSALRYQSAGKVAYQVLRKEVVPAPIDISERLRIAPNTPVIHVARLKEVEGEPIAYTVRYLPESLCPSLLDSDLTKGTIHDILVDHSELPLLRTEMEIEAHILMEEEARLLDASEGEVAIVIERLTYTAPNRPAVWFRAIYKREAAMAIVIESGDPWSSR